MQGEPQDFDWSELFELAELDEESLSPADPEFNPPTYADRRAAWKGSYPDSQIPIQLEAASYAGKPVYFQVTWPDWTTPEAVRPSFQRIPSSEVRNEPAIVSAMLGAMYLVVVVAAAVLARRNLRLGRSDRKGAFRVALYLLSLGMLERLFHASHVLDPGRELGLVLTALVYSIYLAVYEWLVYLALEPYVRRFWPESLIGWSRILSGRFRDPRIGRDLLIGAVVGVSWLIMDAFPTLTGDRLGGPAELRIWTFPYTLLGVRNVAGAFLKILQVSLHAGLIFLLILLLFRLLLRKGWLAGAAFVSFFTVLYSLEVLEVASYLYWVTNAVSLVLYVWLLTRYGLLSFLAAVFVYFSLTSLPITADSSAWYFGSSLFALAAVAALGVYGFYTSLAGRSLFGDALGQR